jgi:peptidyl-prolyl cis-trans isomerase D
VKTQYGFHIIQVIDRETAHTQPLEEVKANIVNQLQQDKAEQLGETLSTQIADEIRRSGRIPIEDLAKKFNMTTGEAKLVEATQLLPELGRAPGLMDGVFHERVGDVSAPIRTDQGFVVTSVKEIQPSHPATLAEVHDRLASDLRHGKALELARSRAEELAKRTKGGENFAVASKALGFDVKTSEPISRSGSIPDVGSSKQFPAAFTMAVGEVSDPLSLGANWAVYRVAEHNPVNQDDYEKQKAKIEEQVLQRKRQTAYELFRAGLKTRLEKEGQLQFNADNLKRLINPS